MTLSEKSRRSVLLSMLAAGGLGALPHAAHARLVCNFGVFPYLPALKIEYLYAPMANELSTIMARPVQLRTKATFEEFREELAGQAYDLALLHPFFLVEAERYYGYVPLGRVDSELSGVVLSCRDKPLRGIESLRGRTLAMPPRLAGVSYLTILALAEHGLVPGVDVEVKHYRTKMSCLHAVATGDADGCVVPNFIVNQLDAIKRMNLVPVARTRAVPGLAIAASSRLEPALRAEIARAMFAWNRTRAGQEVLGRVGWPRLVEARAEDYAMIDLRNEILASYAMH